MSQGGPARLRRPAGPRGEHRFAVADGAEPQAHAASGAAPVSLHSLLALQEAEAEAVQDRAARRHAGFMLEELSALQRALLGGADGGAVAADRLAVLARRSPAAADPRLAAVVQAIAVRAAVEAARRPSQHQQHAAPG